MAEPKLKIIVIGIKTLIDDLKIEFEEYRSLQDDKCTKVENVVYRIDHCDVRLVVDRIYDDEVEHDVLDELDNDDYDLLNSPIVFVRNFSQLSRVRTSLLSKILHEDYSIGSYVIDVYRKDGEPGNSDPFKKVLPELKRIIATHDSDSSEIRE